MAQKSISIYITADRIRICDIVKKGAYLIVNRVFEVETPENSVEDGLIIDVEKIAAAIRQVFLDNRIKKAKLTFTVFSRKIAQKEIELPYVSKMDRISEMIAANAEDYFPMGNMGDYITRFTILDKIEAEGRKFYRIAVYAVQKELVESYYELGKALKMPVLTVDYQVNSLNNLAQKQMRQGISLILQMDPDTTHVMIMSGQAHLFRRSIPFGRDSLVQAIAAQMDIEEENALLLLQDERLLEENIPPEDYLELTRDLSQAITRVVEFYTSKNPILIEQAILYGAGAELIGLGNALGNTLGLTVETVRDLYGVQVRKPKKKQSVTIPLTSGNLSLFLPNIGAVIKPLNLKVIEEAKQKKGSNFLFFYIMIGIAAFSSIGYCVFVYMQKAELESEKIYLEKSIEQLAIGEEIYNSYIALRDYGDIIKSFDMSTVNNNEALYTLLLKLEEIMPESVGIQRLESSDGSITMTAESAGKEAIAMFVMELKKLDYVSGVWVRDIRDVYDEFDNPKSIFTIEFLIYELSEESEGGTQE